MSERLVVIMEDAPAGMLTRMGGGRLRFDYDDNYRDKPNQTPLSVSMPVHVRTHSDDVVTPWLWGLLPDDDAVLTRWGREFQVSTGSPFSLLSTPIGHDCPGAVRFAKPEALDESLGRA